MSEQLMNLKFVAEVKKHPCLYNYKRKDYSKKEVTDKAWQVVAEAVHLTAVQAKERWKNVRSVFVRNIKLYKSKKKKYYLADAMQFVLPYIRLHNLSNQCITTQEERESIEDNEIMSENNESDMQVLDKYESLRSTIPSSPHSEIEESFLEYDSKVIPHNDSQRDANKMFLLSLLPDLNCMSPNEIRAFKREVITLIDNILNVPPGSLIYSSPNSYS